MGDTRTIPTVEEVAATVDDALVAYEIVDGHVVPKVSDTDPHNHVIFELGTELSLWARPRGAAVRGVSFDVRTTPTRRRQPDLLVVTADHRYRIGHRGMTGPPDLVVEVLSPSTRRVDLGDKRAEYAAIGVATYWCIDPESRAAWVFEPPDAEPHHLVGTGVLTASGLEGLAVPLAVVLPLPDPPP